MNQMCKPTVPVKSWSSCRLFQFRFSTVAEKKSDREKKKELAFPTFGAGMFFVRSPFWVGGGARQTTAPCSAERKAAYKRTKSLRTCGFSAE